MGCGTCTTRFRAGDTSASCSSGSCDINGVNKLQVFDWLTNIDLPTDEVIHEYVEIRFKNSRKEIFNNSSNLPLFVGDTVVVEGKPGYDIGVVSLTGRLVSFQLKRKSQIGQDLIFLVIQRLLKRKQKQRFLLRVEILLLLVVFTQTKPRLWNKESLFCQRFLFWDGCSNIKRRILKDLSL